MDIMTYLAHYASDNYDPVKAREYYLKNRDLEGRRAAPKDETKEQRKARVATSQKQREGIAYAKKQLSGKKKAEVKSASEAHESRIEQLRSNAEASRIRIEEKLNKQLESIKAKAVLLTPPEVTLAILNPIPANASPMLRAYLEKQNAAITKRNSMAQVKAKADFAAKQSAAQKQATEATAAARQSAKTEMRRVGSDLKAAVTSAREMYAKSKTQLNANYKTASETEVKNIKANVR